MYNIFCASTRQWDTLKKHAIKIIKQRQWDTLKKHAIKINKQIQKMAKAVEIADYNFTHFTV